MTVFSKFDENHKLTDPRSSMTPKKINTYKTIPRHIIMKLLKKQ